MKSRAMMYGTLLLATSGCGTEMSGQGRTTAAHRRARLDRPLPLTNGLLFEPEEARLLEQTTRLCREHGLLVLYRQTLEIDAGGNRVYLRLLRPEGQDNSVLRVIRGTSPQCMSSGTGEVLIGARNPTPLQVEPAVSVRLCPTDVIFRQAGTQSRLERVAFPFRETGATLLIEGGTGRIMTRDPCQRTRLSDQEE